MRVRSEFLNPDPDGQTGVVEFRSIEIFDGARRVLARTGIAVCERDNGMWNNFGRCPEDFANALNVIGARAGQPARVRLVHAFFAGGEGVEHDAVDRTVP